ERRLDDLADEAAGCRLDGRELEPLLGPEVPKQAALAHPELAGQPADRQPLETLGGGQVDRPVEDRLARALGTQSFSRRCRHLGRSYRLVRPTVRALRCPRSTPHPNGGAPMAEYAVKRIDEMEAV